MKQEDQHFEHSQDTGSAEPGERRDRDEWTQGESGRVRGTDGEGAPAAPLHRDWRSALRKRWFYPAIYLTAAVLIIALMYAKTAQVWPFAKETPAPAPNRTALDTGNAPAVPVGAAPGFIWPADPAAQATVSMNNFDDTLSKEAQAAALVKFDNSYYPHHGIDLAAPNGKPFQVLAAAAGKVSKVEDDPLMGKVVEIAADNGYALYYASLADVSVKPGESVTQGQPIATSGLNKFEAAAKNHVHLEIKKDGQDVNPATLLPEPGAP
ncbi:MAG: M23 family metallopeptidase [Kyrpidia sp.]|nr:M23 family metallopeptidase [Kyrpidia sp.]